MSDAWDAWGTQPQDDSSPTWGDYAKAIGAGAANIGEGAAAASRYFFNLGQSQDGADLSKGFQDLFGTVGGDLTSSMTPEARDRLASTFTSDTFWQHPVSASALKLANMSPMVAAAVVPGGVMADATMGTIATAAAGGALNADGVINEIYKKTDGMSDKDLQSASDYYAGLRSSGNSEKEARRQYNLSLMGMKPALNFVLGAAVGAAGPAGEAVRGLQGAGEAVAGSLARRVAGGAARGAAEMGAQSGVANYTTQLAAQQGGLQKDIDTDALAQSVLEGGVTGALMGGAGSAIARGGKAGKAAKGAKASTPIEEPDRVPEPNQSTPTQGNEDTNAPASVAPAGGASRRAHPRLLPAARAVDRGMDAQLPRLRRHRSARPAPRARQRVV